MARPRLRQAGGVDEHVDLPVCSAPRDEVERLLALGEVGDVGGDLRALTTKLLRAVAMRSVVDVIATRAPRRASSRAEAKPIPASLPQPVTSATRPVKSKGFMRGRRC